MDANQQQQFQQAQRYVDQQDFQAAAPLLNDLNQQVDDLAVHQLLVRTEYELRHFAVAWHLIQEQPVPYQTQPNLQRLALSVAIANQQFIPARKLAGQRKAWLAEIEQAEQVMRQSQQATLATIERQFIHIGDQTFREQQRRFVAADQLPLTEFLRAAKFVLRDPYTNVLIRSSLFQVLAQLMIDEPITLLWLDDQEYVVTPDQVGDLFVHPTVQAINELLMHQYGDQDPVTLQMYQQEFYLQLTLLYPLIEQAIVDPQSWFLALTAYSQTDNDPQIQAAKDWQDRLGRLINRLS